MQHILGRLDVVHFLFRCRNPCSCILDRPSISIAIHLSLESDFNNLLMPNGQENTRPLRVILFSQKGAGLHYGGPGMTAYRLYNSAGPGQFAVTLVHGWSEQERYEVFSDQVFLSQLSQSYRSQFKLFRRSQKWIRANAHRFDVFHGLTAFQVPVCVAQEAERFGLPAVVKVAAHNIDLADKPGWRSIVALPRRRREIIKRLSGVIAISEAIAKELLSYGIPESKIARIPNGVDCQLFHPVDDISAQQRLRERFGWSDRPTIIFSGGLSDRKGAHLLVEALALLKQGGSPCQVVFVGRFDEASYEMKFRSLIEQRGVADDVVLFGLTKETAELYRAADIFCLPSKSEGMPNAMLEAMASGLPTVGTRISGITDLIEEDTRGLLVRRDSAELADALKYYLDFPDQGLTHGKAARNFVERGFSATAVLAAHKQLFRRLMAGQPAAS